MKTKQKKAKKKEGLIRVVVNDKPITPTEKLNKSEKELAKIEEKIETKKQELKEMPVQANPVSLLKPIWTKKGIKQRWKLRKEERVVIAHIELLNGQHKSVYVNEHQGVFRYKNKTYILDNEQKYYNLDFKMYCYDFHEDITLPIKRIVPVADIKTALESSELTEVEYAINPSTIQRFLTAKIAEGIMKGASLDEMFKRLVLIGVITMIATVCHLLIFMFKSGMFEKMKIPGLG